MEIPCYFQLSDKGRSNIPGRIIAFVPRINLDPVPVVLAGMSQSPSIYTVDALIILESFDKDSIYQVPLTRVKVGKLQEEE